jgi:hypothetical protein
VTIEFALQLGVCVVGLTTGPLQLAPYDIAAAAQAEATVLLRFHAGLLSEVTSEHIAPLFVELHCFKAPP